MLTERPTIFRIILTDYYALLGFVLPTMMIIFTGYDVYQGKPISDTNLYVLSTVIFIGLATLASRILTIGSIFEDNLEETGTISSVGFFRGRGTIKYVYTFRGEKYTSQNYVLSSKRTKAVQVDQKLAIMVDQSKPKRAFIKDLYL